MSSAYWNNGHTATTFLRAGGYLREAWPRAVRTPDPSPN